MKDRPSAGRGKGNFRSGSGNGAGGKRPASGARPFGRPGEDKKPFDRKESFKKDGDRPYKKRTADDAGDRPYSKRTDDKKPFERNDRFKKEGDRPYTKRDDKAPSDRPARFKKEDSRSFKPNTFESDKPFGKRTDDKRTFDRPKRDDGRPAKKDAPAGDRPFTKRTDDKKEDTRPFRSRNENTGDKLFAKRTEDRKTFEKNGRIRKEEKNSFDKKDGKRPFEKKGTPRPPKRSYETQGSYGEDKPKRDSKEGSFARSIDYDHKGRSDRPDRPKLDGPKPKREKKVAEIEEEKPKTAFKTPHKHKQADKATPYPAPEAIAATPKPKRKRKHVEEDDEDEEEVDDNKQMTLNKFIAHSGECGRREAAELVKQGKVKVNGELVTDPGYRVQDTDKVTLVGKKLTPTRDLAYVLLNKPKGFITTTEDPQERKTVMDLIDNSGVDRLYPVGRLDRNTSGLLLLTNDGDLAQKLSHPSYAIKKVYQVVLDKNLTKADFEKIAAGVTLDDGIAQVDEIAYLETKNEIGLEIHSGRNRIVRRIFESLGYVVEKLDRVMYAGLTKKNLPRGKWRFLNDQEIIHLKHFKI